MNLTKLFTNPKVAFLIFTLWISIFLIILAHEGVFTNKFLHFGPSKDPKTQTEFLGSPVDSWEKVITIYVLGFLSVCFSTYYYDIFGNWLTNSVRDQKEKKINIDKKSAYLIAMLDPVVSSINKILEFFVVLTMQLQFIIPQLIAEIFVNTFSTRYFLSKKSFAK